MARARRSEKKKDVSATAIWMRSRGSGPLGITLERLLFARSPMPEQLTFISKRWRELFSFERIAVSSKHIFCHAPRALALSVCTHDGSWKASYARSDDAEGSESC